jgi:hypothetical protein
VKALFVGEGKHDIGPAGESWSQPRPATGVVPALARRVCPSIGAESIALAWHDISRFSPSARRGLEAKVAAAILLSARRFDCAGTICVIDRDGDEARLDAMGRGERRGLSAVGAPHTTAVGEAVESIDAWTLGAPSALAEALGIPVERVHPALPKKHVEALRESSEKEEHRPKAVLARIAALANQSDGTTLRRAVAERTSVADLESSCPAGFAPFARKLRASFGV